MATIRLVPSAYYLSNTQYLAVSSVDNMYSNTGSTTYGTVTHNRASTNSTYYMYLRGFNFDDVPSNAEVSSFSIKIKASATGHTTSTSSSYYMSLYNGTTAIGSTSASGRLSTTVTTFTFAIPSSLTWSVLKGYGSDFGIRIPLRRASSNTADVVSVYGAEIEVTYVVPNPRTITTTLTGSGTIEPSGANIYYDEDEFNLIIVPTNTSDSVTATKNGSDITPQLVHHQAGQETKSEVPTEDFTTGFSNSSGAFYQNSSTVSTAWLEYAIGHSAESPYSTSNTSNTYVKPEGSTGWINYTFDFSDIPSSATINSVSVKVYGAREDSTIDSTHVARFQCYSGNTAKGTIQNFTSTSNGSVTVSDVGTWTASELHDAQLRFELGYYGGRMLGITWAVTYTTVEYYTYTMIVSADATIAVVIAGSSNPPIITVGVPTRTIISDEIGYDQCVCTFTSNMALQAWEARATKGVTPARGVGLLVESGTTLAAGATGTVYVENEELTNGDGEYTITVYGQSTQGVWSE